LRPELVKDAAEVDRAHSGAHTLPVASPIRMAEAMPPNHASRGISTPQFVAVEVHAIDH
jgi:hypothetical protein